MAKEMHPEVKKFLEKVGFSSLGTGEVGGFIGQNIPAAVQHPNLSPAVGLAVGLGAGAIGAIIHQRGMAVGQKKAHESLRNEQFNRGRK